MSDIQLPGASARFTGDTSSLRSAVGQAQQTLSNLEPVVARQWWGLQNLSRAFGAFGSFVAGGFGMAIKEAIGWESAMVGIQRTTGASGAELDDLEAKLRKVAETTPIAVSELANLAEQAGALGIANTDIPEFVRVLGNLIAATNLTTADVDDLARVLNILQVPVESFDRFASTLLEVGRNTAATETEILAMAKRFAPAAQAAGVLADEVLAISAAIISLGPRAEAGGTAVNKTFFDMSTAITKGGSDLELFAQVSGKTTDQFVSDFQNKPAQTFADFVTGLGHMEGGLLTVNKVLADLGITEVRQRQALIALADGTQLTGDQQRDLNAILDMAHKAWRDNTALVEVAHQRYGTTAAQLTLLRNRLGAVANTIGQQILPYLGWFIDRLADLVAGFQALPGPLQFVIGAAFALLGGLSLLAGGVLALIGPIVLMMQSWRSLQKVLQNTGVVAAESAAPLTEEAAVVERVGATAVVAAEQLSMFTAELQLNAGAAAAGATQLTLFSAETGMAATKTAQVEGASLAAAGGMSRMAKGGMVLMGVMALATVAMTIFGHHARESADATDEAAKADLGLVDAMEAQAKGQKGAADDWLLQQITMSGVIDTANALGGELWGLVDVLNVIKGTASFEQAKTIIDTIKGAADAGDAKAKALLDFMIQNSAVWQESASASGQLSAARGELGIATDGAASAEGDLGDATDDTTKKQEAANQATIDLISAYMSEADAALAVKEAQQAYAEAVANAANPTLALAEAENKLAQERENHADAQRDLEEAEKRLANARTKQYEDLRDAEDDLKDSQDKYLDSLDRIADAEQKLEDLRNGPTLKQITDATNKLADAQLRLRHNEQAVKDAEWQLAYLRGEGASDRAVQDAELALDDARQGVADQTADVANAEDDLAKLRAGADPKELAKAERDLEKARRDSGAALRDINDKETAVKKLRDDIAHDRAYHDAQQDVIDIQGKVYDTLKQVQQAEIELAKLRTGSLDDAVAKAQRDLEKSLVDQAKAAVEVQKQQAILRGEYWDTGREAQALADQLSLLLDQAPTPESRQHLQDWIDTLRQAKPGQDPNAAATTPEDILGKLPSNKDITDYLAGMAGKGDGGGGGKSLPERILEGLMGGGGSGVGAPVGGLTGAAIGTFLFPGVGTVAGFLIGTIVGGLVDEFYPEIMGFLSGAGSWLQENIPRYLGNTGTWFRDTIYGGLQGALSTAGSWLVDTGANLAGGLQRGLSGMWFDNVMPFFQDTIYGNIQGWASTAGSWLVDTGANLISGFWNGVTNMWNGFYENVLSQIPGWIIDGVFGNAIGWLTGTGWDIIVGLWNGLVNSWNTFYNTILSNIPTWFRNIIGDPLRFLWDIGYNLVIGLWNGLVDAWNAFWGWLQDRMDDVRNLPVISWILGSPSKLFARYGKNLMEGLQEGIKGSMGLVTDAMDKVVDATSLANSIPITADIAAQFATDTGWRDLATNAAAYTTPTGTTPASIDNSSERGGDLIQITGADERSALDIAEEVMFKKLVKTG